MRRCSILLLLCAVPLSVSAGSLQIDLQCRFEPPCAINGALLLRSSTDASLVRREAINGTRALITGSAESAWDVSLEATGFWSLAQRVVIPAEEIVRQETMKVWRTGQIRARIQSADPLPVELTAFVVSAPDRKSPPEIPAGTGFTCSRRGPGPWICELPATLLDVALHAKGFAPHYRWDVHVPAASALDLGTVVLKKGASLVAWLDPESLKELRGSPVQAVLRHRVAGDPSLSTLKLATPVAEGRFSSKGMVQLAPLPAGHYVLETSAKGYARSSIPVEVLESRESVLRRSIELSRSVSARLRLDPPLAPDGAPWNINIWRRVDSGTGWERAAGGAATAEGLFEAADQAEGPVKVVAQDARHNVLANRQLVFVDGTPEYLVSLEVAAITGEVSLGDERLGGAALLFGGSGGSEKVRTTADELGRFSVALPRRGKWAVDVDAPDAAVSATAEIDLPPDRDEIAIELPATEVSGWVTGPDGERIPAAEVRLLARSGARKRMTDSSGNFRFRGVREGTLHISATNPSTGEYSKVVDVIVPEEGVTANIALAIEAFHEVKGVVRSGGNVVPGARVNGYAFTGGAAQQERATTDINGGFTLKAPESAPEMILVVGSPGRPLQAFTVAVPQRAVLLELPPRGGALRLRLPQKSQPMRVLFNDIMLPVSDLLDWARAHGEVFNGDAVDVPNVSAGKYQLCDRQRCTEGLLAIGGRLELDLGSITETP